MCISLPQVQLLIIASPRCYEYTKSLIIWTHIIQISANSIQVSPQLGRIIEVLVYSKVERQTQAIGSRERGAGMLDWQDTIREHRKTTTKQEVSNLCAKLYTYFSTNICILASTVFLVTFRFTPQGRVFDKENNKVRSMCVCYPSRVTSEFTTNWCYSY